MFVRIGCIILNFPSVLSSICSVLIFTLHQSSPPLKTLLHFLSVDDDGTLLNNMHWRFLTVIIITITSHITTIVATTTSSA